MLAEIMKYIAPALITAIGSLLTYALAKLAAFLHAKAEGSKLFSALAVAEDFVKTAVAHAQEQLEPELKAALADGKLDDAERAKLLADALALVKAQLPAGIGDVLDKTMGPALETWLSGKVAAAVPPKAP